MLTHPTLDQLRALKLEGMAQAFVELEAQEDVCNLAHAEWLAVNGSLAVLRMICGSRLLMVPKVCRD